MPGPVLRLRGRRAEVRRDDDVVALEQRVLGERLLGEDVEGRAADLARLEAASSASRSTSSPRAQLTIRTPSFICAMASASMQLTVSGVFGRWIVMKSARCVQLVRRLRALDAQLPEALGGDELVEGDDLHVERLRALGDQLADPPEADHAERLP